MELTINGVRAEDRFEIDSLAVTDNAGGQADSMEMALDTDVPDFAIIAPQKGDVIRFADGSLDSGRMYVDECRQIPGQYTVKAMAIPHEAKLPHNRGWEDVRLSDLIEETAQRYGFGMEIYSSTDFRYQRLRQKDTSDLDFLRMRCMLEGWTLKVYDQKLIAYNCYELEAVAPQRTLSIEGDYRFVDSSAPWYDAVHLVTPTLSAEYRQSEGSRVLTINNIPFFSLAEGQRYCRGILHAQNRKARRQTFPADTDMPVAAGAVVRIEGEGLQAGKYFVERVRWNHNANAMNVEAGAING